MPASEPTAQANHSSTQPSAETAPASFDLLVQHYTNSYLATLRPGAATPEVIAGRLAALATAALATIDPSTRTPIRNPTLAQVAATLISVHHVVRLNEKGAASERSQVAVYMAVGTKQGTFSTDEGDLRRLARRYSPNMSRSEAGDLLQALVDQAPAVEVCDDRDLVAVNNGIFDYATKELRDFTPEVVLLSKSPVDYVPNPTSPVLTHADGTTWELEAWLQEIATVHDADGGASFVDDEVVEALWRIAGAINRPLVNWNKAAFLYSTTGNNGKGTFAEFLRGLTGPAATNIPLADLGKEFYLENLTSASAIIADENDVGIFLDRVGNLKALITQDVLYVNRKNKTPIAMRWRGLMVQCLNSLPETRDKSQSFYRRQLFVPFRNRFEGVERKYIKSDYLRRDDVLQYALHRTLHMPDFYELRTPGAGMTLMREYMRANDNIREFWEEVEPRLVWDIVPNAFLYDLYGAWMLRYNPSGKPLGRNKLLVALREIIAEGASWRIPVNPTTGKPAQLRIGAAMRTPETLIDEYDLTRWMAPGYTGNNPHLRCMPAMGAHTTGIVRRTPTTAPGHHAPTAAP